MRQRGGFKPGVFSRTIGGTTALAATLVRMSAGIVAVACLGYFFKDRVKNKKNRTCANDSEVVPEHKSDINVQE